MAYLETLPSSPARTAPAVALTGRTSLTAFRRFAPPLAGAMFAGGVAWTAGLLGGAGALALVGAAFLALSLLTVRRLHDIGCGGWLVGVQLALISAIVGTGAAIYGHTVGLLLGEGLLGSMALALATLAAMTARRVGRPGEPGPNRYGPEAG